MSAESTKRRVKRNKQILNKIAIRIAMTNIIAVLINRVVNKTFLSKTFLITAILEGFLVIFLAYLTKTTFIKNSKGLEIRDRGVDLSARGVLRIVIDSIYSSLATKIASILFGSKAFFSMLIFIPITAYYEIFMRREVRKKPKH